MQSRSNSRRRPIIARPDIDESVLLETDSNTCPARHILDEKTESGKRQFLVDWAPTWEPFRTSDYPIREVLRAKKEAGRATYLIDWEPTWTTEVTHDILSEWEQRGRVSVAPSLSDCSIQEDQDVESQSPRPSNWRRTSGFKRHAQSNEAPPAKRTRGLASNRFSEASSPGPVRSTHDPSPREPFSPSRQTYSLASTFRQDITVDLPKNPNLDPSEYLSIDGSQTTYHSSQPLSQLESQDSILAINKQLFPLEIPDSQDPTQSSESHGQPWPVIADSQNPLLSSAERAQPLGGSDDPVASVEEVVPDSAIKVVEIPSRQEVSFVNTTFTNTIHPNEASLNTIRDHEQTSPLYRDTSSLQQPVQQPPSTQASTQENRPYLSQPLFDLQLSQVSSISGPSDHPAEADLLSSHTIEDSRGASDHSQQNRESDPFTQAAQIVSQPIGFSPQDGHNNSSGLSVGSLAGQGTYQPSTVVFARSASFRRSGASPRSRNPRPDSPTSDKMDESREQDMQDSTEIPNATDQIKGILDFRTYETIGPDVAMPSMFPIDDAPVTASIPVAEVGSSASNPLHHAQVTIQSQPVSLESPSQTLDTVTPGEVLKFDNLEGRTADTPLFLDEPATLEDPDSSHEALPMGQGDPDSTASSPDDTPYQEKRQWVVTLPFAAALRPVYDEILLSYRRPAQQYSRCITDDISQEPSSDLVQSVDKLFTKLQEVCNFPPNLHGTALETLDAREKARYAHDSNAKISFIYELLQDITEDRDILIVAQSVELLRLLHNITEALNIQCISSAIETDPQTSTDSAARVTLALSTESIDRLEEYDMIIGYDRSFKTSSIATEAAKIESVALGSESRLPLILMLVTTFSFEHFDLYVDYRDAPLERRQALLYSLFEARRVVIEPDCAAPEPHEIAQRFSEKLNGNNDLIAYAQTEMLSDLLHPGTQESETQREEIENDRKRKHDDDEAESYKRMKAVAEMAPLAITQMPPVPDDVQKLLDNAAPAEASERQTLVNVPLAALQGLVQQFAELERKAAAVDLEAETSAVIAQLSARVKEFERTTDQTYEALRAAVEERHRFEAEKAATESKLAKEVEARKKDGEKASKRITELEADVSRLTGGDDAAEKGESPLARSERLLKEAQDKLALSEKRVVNAQDDREYMRTQYQTASAAAGAASSEMNALKDRLEKAETEATGKKLEIQKINLEHNSRQYLRKISELESLVKERNIEYDRVREELRVLRNGRRETRQVSVPRSPRMGMMSPRAPVRSYPGSASRSGSPAPGADIASFAGGSVLPGMQLFPPSAPANGRYSNLRE